MKNTVGLSQFIYNQHNVVCNQKYGDNLPYSFHLKAVEAQGMKFISLLDNNESVNNPDNFRSVPTNIPEIVKIALLMHDSIEDSRLTYNDIKNLASESLENSVAGEMIADIVYCVTDEKGKNRGERKNEKYYKELSENKLAVFVKLADLAANTLYSKLTGSSMYEKYKSEFPKFKEKVYVEEYKEFFDYVENI